MRNGWFATPSAPSDVVAAVRLGGVLSCISALRRTAVWCLDDYRLHVAVDRHASHLSSPSSRRTPLGDPHRFGVEVHTDARRIARLHSPCDSVIDALPHLVRCRPRAEVIAVLDSALNSGLMTNADLTDLFAGLPSRYSRYRAAVDASCQSGTETFVRLLLRRLGIGHRTQVVIDGVGRVDFVVGERLVVEVDSTTWHAGAAAFEQDRQRDLRLRARNYSVLRLSYSQVMGQRDEVEAVIRSQVAGNEHRWSSRHRKLS